MHGYWTGLPGAVAFAIPIDSRLLFSAGQGHRDMLVFALQIDRNEDMIRSCLRAVDAVSRIHNIETNAAFRAFMTNTVAKGALQTKLKAIQEERAEGRGNWAESYGYSMTMPGKPAVLLLQHLCSGVA